MISFVIPAHNEARLLAGTLQAVHTAASALGRPFEVLVVDDASADGTGAVAEAHGARVLRVEHRHIAATRNAGARNARGAWLVFVDADTRIDHAVLHAAGETLSNGAAGGGATVRLDGTLRWHERASAAFFISVLRRARIAPGCFIFCTRTAFEAAGGFDERLFAGEDVAISRALARQGRFVILRETVATSARKLRTFSTLDHLRLLARFALRGRRLLHSRQGLELWYGTRRDEEPR